MRNTSNVSASPRRREFLQLLSAGAAGFVLPGGRLWSAPATTGKPLRGIFPIAQSPFTTDDKLDLQTLAAEVKFIDKGGVHGFVWPQMASEWTSLTDKERMDGVEAILGVGKKLRPAIVIGVQAPDVATAVSHAKHARATGADAIIALPPSDNADQRTMLEYYKTIAGAADLPMFVQAVGNGMTIDFMLEMYKAIPEMRYVKDEAGNPLERVGPLREKTHDELKVFSGAHGRTLVEEMRRGFSGSMPAASFADLYAQTWNLWHAGKHAEAMDMHARTLLLLTEMTTAGTEGMKYILYLRGVFKTWHNSKTIRVQGFANAAAIAAGGAQGTAITEASKKTLKETVDHLKPYFKA